MKDKEGFTLMELIVVIAILAALTIIAVPAILGVSNKVKQNLLESKISYAEQALLLWSQDNKKCFTEGGSNCLTMSCSGTDLRVCDTSLLNMAQFGLINYDKGTSILNPVDNKDIKFSSVRIKYDTVNRSFEIMGTTISSLPVPHFTFPTEIYTITAEHITIPNIETTTEERPIIITERTTRNIIVPIRTTAPLESM